MRASSGVEHLAQWVMEGGQGTRRPRRRRKGSAHTTEATRTSPNAEGAATTQRNLQREDRGTVQGPVRKPAKDETSHRGGLWTVVGRP